MPERDYFVHPTAVIDEPCRIGKGTKIWHFCHVMKDAEIGENCVLGQNCYIGSRARLGDNCKIQNNVSLYDCIILEDDVFCGPSMVFTNVANPRSHVSRKDEYEETLVQQGATISANATVVCGTTVGRYAFIGAGAVVTKDVPDYALVVGVPGANCRMDEPSRPSNQIRRERYRQVSQNRRSLQDDRSEQGHRP